MCHIESALRYAHAKGKGHAKASTPCNTLQHTAATHCNSKCVTATVLFATHVVERLDTQELACTATHCNTLLQHTATRCNSKCVTLRVLFAAHMLERADTCEHAQTHAQNTHTCRAKKNPRGDIIEFTVRCSALQCVAVCVAVCCSTPGGRKTTTR